MKSLRGEDYGESDLQDEGNVLENEENRWRDEDNFQRMTRTLCDEDNVLENGENVL